MTLGNKITYATTRTVPDGFVIVNDIDPAIIIDLRYAGTDNFLGRVVKSYESQKLAYMTKEAAYALQKVQYDIKKDGYTLVIYDSYRPQDAVDDFYTWSLDNTIYSRKEWFYPALDKTELFTNGYIARKSAHSRGSTIDLSMIKLGEQLKKLEYKYIALPTGKKIGIVDDGTVDMGTSFDYLGEESHTAHNNITQEQRQNRLYLKEKMEKHGFDNYHKEWWHFSFINEPFKDTYFNF